MSTPNQSDKIDLSGCLAEINNALNFWYPLSSNDASKEEIGARHLRLFGFRDRLKLQLAETTGREEAK